jgi:hypothetical protein
VSATIAKADDLAPGNPASGLGGSLNSWVRLDIAGVDAITAGNSVEQHLNSSKHTFFAVTDNNGSFELKDLPPDTYTLTAWQEKPGPQNQKVTVGASETKPCTCKQ